MDVRATDVLREEHERILAVLGVFEQIIEATPGPPEWESRPDAGAIADCLTFFRLFTDACHHGQEETVLFEELVERGLPRSQGPIAMMLNEHEQGRALVRAMTAALDEVNRGGSAAWPELERAARDYTDLLRAHIGKENGILFEMADQLISGPACERMCERYHPACLERLQGRTKLELESLAAQLLAAYPPDAD